MSRKQELLEKANKVLNAAKDVIEDGSEIRNQIEEWLETKTGLDRDLMGLTVENSNKSSEVQKIMDDLMYRNIDMGREIGKMNALIDVEQNLKKRFPNLEQKEMLEILSLSEEEYNRMIEWRDREK